MDSTEAGFALLGWVFAFATALAELVAVPLWGFPWRGGLDLVPQQPFSLSLQASLHLD